MATKKSMWLLFGIFVISAWVLGSAIQAGAETLKITVSAYATQSEIIPVADVPGHVITAGIRRGLAFFENGDVATYTNWGTADLIKGRGSNNGYTMFTFEDGSSIFYAVKGVYEPGPKGFGVGKGTGEFTGGTGKYEGIKGSLTWTSKFYTIYSKEKGTFGDFSLEITGTYTLPQK